MPKLVVFTGLLGTGKSTLAVRLAREKNWRLLQVDKLRRLMIPRPEYNDQEMLMVYRVMLKAAGVWLENGFGVILDATFSIPEYHRLLKKLVEKTGAGLRVFRCVCSDREAVKRLTKRMKKGRADALDTTPARYFEHKKKFQLIDFCPVVKLDTGSNRKIVFRQLRKHL